MHEDAVEGRTVEDVYEADLRLGAIVDDSAPLIDVAETLDYEEALDAIYVVDTRDRYLGIVTRSDLLGWLEQELSSPQTRTGFPWDRLRETMEKARAADAVNPASREAAVEPRDPLERAVRNMLSSSLTVVPVVTPEGDIEGELALTHVLREVKAAPGGP